ncbi:MAG: hypothetical protein IPM75_09740 [Candidatus Competibacteraceae bacterium]|nr:hypothetical protein [Candidatus Competibacteraceae bacterium]MBK8963342.1 hypothetical protein [Candidatus Competibacteraceae bacterium]
MLAITQQPYLTPLAAHALIPAAWMVLDCETGDAPSEATAAALEAWKPPKNWKPATAEAKRGEIADRINSKAALLDASPILCVALKTDQIAVVLNGMSAESFEVPGWLVLPCCDEKGLLLALRAVLDQVVAADTVIVGHNLFGFDAGKLRNAFLRHRLRLPNALANFDQPMFDTMRQIRYFSMELADERFVSLDTVARVLGIPQPKQVINGADCPRLHKEGQYAVICTYCCIDMETTTRAYLLMSGQSAELE